MYKDIKERRGCHSSPAIDREINKQQRQVMIDRRILRAANAFNQKVNERKGEKGKQKKR